MTEVADQSWIKNKDAYMNFMVGASVMQLRNHVKAMEAYDTEKEYTYQINSMYAAIDRLKRAE
jgi:hypothetical protein